MEWDSLKRDISRALAKSLNANLREIGGESWWEKYVLDELTPAQRVQVCKLLEADLFQLDMAALLRLFDRNWAELVFKRNYPKNGRNLVKELVAVRNRWAHEPATGHELEDLYRDLDTARRFLTMVEADADLISRVNTHRVSVLDRLAGNSKPPEQIPSVPDSPPENELLPLGGNSGASLTVIGAGGIRAQDASQFALPLKTKSYIGIDFGTSTTVASYIRLAEDGSHVVVAPIDIPQPQPDGRITRYHLVPSCIALNPRDNSVIFGIGAKELQYQLREGIDVWSSFKMELGIDLGPKYRNTKLKAGQRDIVVEKPQDAAREFFKFLRAGINDFLQRNDLPSEIALSVSVPASFEANQRRDLIRALVDAGFVLDESSLIDEPNAAFLSVLHDSWLHGAGFVDFLQSESRNILVFDFGAGTCDISILRVSVADNAVKSKNLSISRFIALGGNNIDRAIAEDVLLPQMLSQSSQQSGVTSEQIAQIVIPRLMPVAERLKIHCSKVLAQRGISSIEECAAITDNVTEHGIPDLVIGANTMRLNGPTLSFAEFGQLMAKFIAVKEPEDAQPGSAENAVSIFVPIQSALTKAHLSKTDLHSIIFIGGSSENPLIQGVIRNHFGRFVDTMVPRDLRTHVSQGTAFHSFAHHAFGADVIQPITSEPMMLVTANGGLETILDAGTEVPTRKPFVSRFAILRDEQSKVELPICVTSEDKILSVLSISPNELGHFSKGQILIVECRMTQDKLLEISVTVDGRRAMVEQLNPLANTSLTEDESKFLLARQRFNKSVLGGNGRPPIGEVIAYARAASDAAHYLWAAELYEQIELMEPNRNYAVSICYNYDRASRSAQAEKWALTAYEREKTATTAFNVAIFMHRSGKIIEARRFLDEALVLNPNYSAALVFLGEILEGMNESGHAHFEKAVDLLRRELTEGSIDEDDCKRLARVARQLGETQLASRADIAACKLRKDRDLYNEEHLVGTAGKAPTMSKRS